MSDQIIPQWQENASSSLKLNNDDIHVWRIWLNTTQEQQKKQINNLNLEEQARAQKFVFDHHRARFITARYALREILAKYSNIDAKEIAFGYENDGKPYLFNNPAIQFNLSHSENMAVCAITMNNSIGVDVEYLKKDNNNLAIAERFFASEEYQYLNQLPQEQRTKAFYQFWTGKEAIAKASGIHLADILKKRFSEKEWHLQVFIPAKDYLATVAISRHNNNLSFYDFSFNDHK